METLAYSANGTIADVLKSKASEPLTKAFAEADMVFDFSASVPVARYLARDVDSSGRRMSLFLNPAGTDLVLLAEDEKRTISVDCLEMQ